MNFSCNFKWCLGWAENPPSLIILAFEILSLHNVSSGNSHFKSKFTKFVYVNELVNFLKKFVYDSFTKLVGQKSSFTSSFTGKKITIKFVYWKFTMINWLKVHQKFTKVRLLVRLPGIAKVRLRFVYEKMWWYGGSGEAYLPFGFLNHVRTMLFKVLLS